MQHSRQVKFYRLGSGSKRPSWPYEVSYAPDFRPRDFFLAEGDARHGNGGFFPAIIVLTDAWRLHLEVTQTLWLLPLLERLAGGEKVPCGEILEAYRQEHGEPPEVEEKTLYGDV